MIGIPRHLDIDCEYDYIYRPDSKTEGAHYLVIGDPEHFDTYLEYHQIHHLDLKADTALPGLHQRTCLLSYCPGNINFILSVLLINTSSYRKKATNESLSAENIEYSNEIMRRIFVELLRIMELRIKRTQFHKIIGFTTTDFTQ